MKWYRVAGLEEPYPEIEEVEAVDDNDDYLFINNHWIRKHTALYNYYPEWEKAYEALLQAVDQRCEHLKYDYEAAVRLRNQVIQKKTQWEQQYG